MSNIKATAALVLLVSVGAPLSAFAQQEEFLPDSYSARKGDIIEAPTNAYGSAVAEARSRRLESRSTPPDFVVTDPERGDIIGADPDPEVRLELRRDPPSDRE